MTKLLPGLVFTAMCFTGTVFADWTLASDTSRMNFMSVKKGEIIETHHFKKLSGTITEAGKAVIEIDLSSVTTNIEIRDERMQALLFDVPSFPVATVTASVDTEVLAALEDGQRVTQKVSLELDLHGMKSTIETEVFITNADNDSVTVATTQPIVISADDFNLGAGVEALREIAKLPAITHNVPVTFNLMFDQH
ncbi:MAG: YceI family protein [Granulosicoccus sp.]